MTKTNNNFFGLFTFEHLMHDVVDKTIVYHGIKILQDIRELGFKRDQVFDAVWFSIDEMKFSFIDWVPNPDETACFYTKPETLLEIEQKVLAPYLVW